MYISHESVPAALPQGNEPMEWIHCMLVIEWGLGAHNMISTVRFPGSLLWKSQRDAFYFHVNKKRNCRKNWKKPTTIKQTNIFLTKMLAAITTV